MTQNYVSIRKMVIKCCFSKFLNDMKTYEHCKTLKLSKVGSGHIIKVRSVKSVTTNSKKYKNFNKVVRLSRQL